MRTIANVLVLVLLAASLVAGPLQQVSREHWSYDLLASLAAQGLVPGKSARDFSLLYQYSRSEMARMVADSLDYTAGLPDMPGPVRSALRKLMIEYGREAPLAGRELPESAPSDSLLVTPSAELDVQAFSDSDGPDGGRTELRLSVLYNAEVPDIFWDLQMNAGHDPLDPLFGDKVRPPFGRATLRAHHSWYDFELGRQPLRWGPGYLSSTSISDLSRPMYLARFSTDIRAGRLRLPYEQFVGVFRDQGMRKWLVGRRVEVPLGSKVTWGFGEFAKCRDIPHPATFVLPLQAAQEWFLKKEYGDPAYESEMNIAISTDLACRFSPRLHGYGEWTLDDAQISFLGFGGANVPYKAAYLVGLYSPDLFGDERTSARAEYALSSPQAYLHDDPRMSLFNEGVPIGHSMGPDSDTLLLRVDHKLSQRDSAILTLRRAHHGRRQAAVQTDTMLDLTYTRDICPNGFVTATVQTYKSENVGNVAGVGRDGTRIVVAASARY